MTVSELNSYLNDGYRYWTKNGNYIKDANGKLILCKECPCRPSCAVVLSTQKTNGRYLCGGTANDANNGTDIYVYDYTILLKQVTLPYTLQTGEQFLAGGTSNNPYTCDSPYEHSITYMTYECSSSSSSSFYYALSDDLDYPVETTEFSANGYELCGSNPQGSILYMFKALEGCTTTVEVLCHAIKDDENGQEEIVFEDQVTLDSEWKSLINGTDCDTVFWEWCTVSVVDSNCLNKGPVIPTTTDKTLSIDKYNPPASVTFTGVLKTA